MFFEPSTRTQSSFELAGRKLGADVMNMGVAASSVKKGETLIDTALTLNAMRPDLLVVRHPMSGAVDLLASEGADRRRGYRATVALSTGPPGGPAVPAVTTAYVVLARQPDGRWLVVGDTPTLPDEGH